MNSEDKLSRSQKLLSSSNFCNEAYKLMVKGITSTPDKSQSKWIADYENFENLINLDKSYVLIFTAREKLNFRLSNLSFLTEELQRMIISLK